MMFYKNTKIRSVDGYTYSFYIVAGVQQENAFASYPFIIYLDYLLGTSIDIKKENGLREKKVQKQTKPRAIHYGHRLRGWHSSSDK